MSYTKKIEVRWSDLDPNFHMLHSKYYDLGAYIRMCYFVEKGITEKVLMDYGIGPILLREECIFRREIKFGDLVEIDLHLYQAKENFGRWSFKHIITRNGELAAQITVDGAWINLQTRKMAIPPESFTVIFNEIPKADDFKWI